MSATIFTLWGCLACLLLALGPVSAQAQTGLRVGHEHGGMQAPWPRWQTRIGVTTNASGADASATWQINAGQLLGDYYWGATRLGGSDGVGAFRATSGLLLGQRSLALGTTALASGQAASMTVSRATLRPALPARGDSTHEAWSTVVPYIGFGYSGISLRGGWGFTADFGLAPDGGLRARRDGEFSAQGLDDLLRELRLRPILQFGASYAF